MGELQRKISKVERNWTAMKKKLSKDVLSGKVQFLPNPIGSSGASMVPKCDPTGNQGSLCKSQH